MDTPPRADREDEKGLFMKNKPTLRGKIEAFGIVVLVVFSISYLGVKLILFGGYLVTPLDFTECWCDYGYGGFRCNCNEFCEFLEEKCNVTR